MAQAAADREEADIDEEALEEFGPDDIEAEEDDDVEEIEDQPILDIETPEDEW